jgi:hypothetical protein
MPIHNQLASGRGRGLNLTAADTVHSAADVERISEDRRLIDHRWHAPDKR